MSPAGVIDRMLEPLSRCLDVESARRVAALSFPAEVQDRMDLLGDRANEGVLTAEERAEYEALVNTADVVSILKLKARDQLFEKP